MNEMTSGNGSLYELYNASSQNYLYGRMPQVGDKRVFADGREFVFVSTAVDVAVGQLVAAAQASAELANKLTAATAGAEKITVEVASVTANQYAGGYITITDGTNAESTYPIRSNTASDGNDEVVLTLAAPLAAAITATDDCILVPSLYSNVRVSIVESVPVGVAVIASTAGANFETQWMWVQTRGIGGIKITTAANITEGVALKQIASGSVGVQTAGTPIVAIAANVAEVSDGDVCPCRIMIESLPTAA
jgi:hypothetical protein